VVKSTYGLVVTVYKNWATQPDSTTTYVIGGNDLLDASDVNSKTDVIIFGGKINT